MNAYEAFRAYERKQKLIDWFMVVNRQFFENMREEMSFHGMLMDSTLDELEKDKRIMVNCGIKIDHHANRENMIRIRKNLNWKE